MSFYYTSDELIKSIKLRASIPTSQNRFKNEDFLRFANEELSIALTTSIMKNHEDYFLYSEDVALTSSIRRYQIPYRAIGNKLRDVSFVNAQGDISEMTRISIGDVTSVITTNQNSTVYAYYLASNEVVLVPENGGSLPSGYLRFSYYLRPNSLVLLEKVAVISSIDRNTGVIQLSQLPADFSTSLLFDFVQIKSPHKCLSIEKTALAINPTLKTITFNPQDISLNLSVGDHITKVTESAIPQIPSDMHMILAHRVATRILESMGDTEGLTNANQKLAELEQNINTLVDNRVEDSPKKVVNHRSILRTGLFARRYNR